MTWLVILLVLIVSQAWVGPWLLGRNYLAKSRLRRLQEQLNLHQLWLEAADQTTGELWGWLKKANARRKRIESALRRQREFGDSMHRRNLSLLEDVRQLVKHVRSIEEENEKLQNRNRHLAGELVNDILLTEDRATVTKGLTRKL